MCISQSPLSPDKCIQGRVTSDTLECVPKGIEEGQEHITADSNEGTGLMPTHPFNFTVTPFMAVPHRTSDTFTGNRQTANAPGHMIPVTFHSQMPDYPVAVPDI